MTPEASFFWTRVSGIAGLIVFFGLITVGIIWDWWSYKLVVGVFAVSTVTGVVFGKLIAHANKLPP